ncbi:DUF4406 domain-containing protein [Corynebacterium glutamicum]|uniref:DUF4406 domain-containing protein n=1 Tax=Corynebacterium glutamicum TaxID=1718 RepID=UPI0007C60E28|nr:DUF4406 domain-containing protein [Corynebacterium glutamicum]ANE09046.1 hypothetical protein A3654_12030 [Corynebacterium glutamicum]
MTTFKPRVFISGSMTGIEYFNYPAFHHAAYQLEAEFSIISPAHRDNGMPLQPPSAGSEKPWTYYMRDSLRKLMEADCIFMLPGWETSRGAQIEHHLAELLDIKVINPNILGGSDEDS